MRDWDNSALNALRGAVFRGDETALLEELREWRIDSVLQLVGDALADAVARGVPEVAGPARQCEAALRKRGWAGDERLAERLSGVLRTGPTPMLRPLPVALDELSDILEGDPAHGGGHINLESGMCLPELIEYEELGLGPDELDDPDRWLYVPCEGSHHGYRDMELFIATLDNPDVVDRLDIAIQGRGAFRRFRDVLSRRPDELQRYFQFSEERKLRRAREWLAAHGYRPVRAGAPEQ